MARPAKEHPTALELQILKVLWEKSPLLVRDVRQALAAAGRDLAHTSVITTLNTMVDKGYLKRFKRGNAFLFEPRIAREATSKQMLNDLVDRVFDGSMSALMLSLFDDRSIEQEELRELKSLFNRKLKEQQK